jgi:hypothetical protein
MSKVIVRLMAPFCLPRGCAQTRASECGFNASTACANCRHSKPNPQRDEQLIDRVKLGLKGLDDPSPTPNPRKITIALRPRQRFKRVFQRPTNFDLPTIEQSPEVLGLIRIGVAP